MARNSTTYRCNAKDRKNFPIKYDQWGDGWKYRDRQGYEYFIQNSPLRSVGKPAYNGAREVARRLRQRAA